MTVTLVRAPRRRIRTVVRSSVATVVVCGGNTHEHKPINLV